jgi:putative endonuclease
VKSRGGGAAPAFSPPLVSRVILSEARAKDPVNRPLGKRNTSSYPLSSDVIRTNPLFLVEFPKTGAMRYHQYYIYIITNERKTVLYAGVTNDLVRRCHEHSKGLIPGFSKKYNLKRLVYYELFDDINLAIAREKQIKGIKREKKDALISQFNPEWKDLYREGVVLRPDEGMK